MLIRIFIFRSALTLKSNVMKKSLALFFILPFVAQLNAQNVKKIENLKDQWQLTFNYTGEVKDGKPNGMGVAKYASGNVVRYVGSFVNGMYNGKGTMFFDDGAFLTGMWKNGKLSGKGSNLNADGSLFIGEFSNGVKNGQGLLVFKDNSFVKGNYQDDKMSGRCINVWTDGTIVSDIIYANDKRNGPGYQYEAKSKKLYEGEWKDDKWAQAASPNFSSFLKSASFTGESTSDHILMGAINSEKFLVDTSYYYDLKGHKRYFGYYESGHLRNGLIIRDDSTRFYGPLNNNGANGYCYDFKFGKYFSEGVYTDDFLNGPILDLDLTKKSAYYGDAVKGEFSGKAYFFNESGTMYVGDYLKGRFTGNGFRYETSGKYVSGTWNDGKITALNTVITPKGDIINGAPKTLAEAINSIIKDFPESYFDDITGDIVDDYEITDELDESVDTSSYLDYSYSLFQLPGSVQDNVIATDFDLVTYYYAKMLETPDATKATAKYKELATQLQNVSISNSYYTTKVKLQGTITAPDPSNDTTETEFSLPSGSDKLSYFKVWLTMSKNLDDKYVVSISLGEKE